MLLQATDTPTAEILPPIDTVQGSHGAFAAASVVHDLGNLIQIASSAINILVRTPGMPAAHAGPILHRARTSLEHAGAIVRENIGTARGVASIEARSDVVACLADIAALVGAMDEPGLKLEIEIAEMIPELRCDPVGLRRAVLNLILNARDAMGGQGTIWIAAREAESAVELRVMDHGIGMSPATVARAFDPFFTTKEDGLGGIGLSMVERFVRGAGGSVSIDSEPGIGTTVTLRLPATSAAQNPSEELNP